MLKKFLSILLFCIFYLLPVTISSQNLSKRNIVYIEALGAGGYGSINYERILFEKNFVKMGIRGGFSTYHITDYINRFNPDLIFPVSINAHFVYKQHTLVFCIGETISNIVHASKTDYQPERKTNFSTFFDIGYAYEWRNGLCLGVGYTPIIYKQDYRNWFKLSFGYAF